MVVEIPENEEISGREKNGGRNNIKNRERGGVV